MKPVTIVGGGIAGLACGIALRQREIPAVLWEAGDYPRHRVCGEFLSGHGLQTLRRLGLLERCVAAGAQTVGTVRFFSGRSQTSSVPLPGPAMALARVQFDDLLAGIFQELGGDLRASERFRGCIDQEGIVAATGRQVQRRSNGWRWVGLKAHATGVELTDDLELHFLKDGYVGLCRLSEGRVNVCGLFRSRGPMAGAGACWDVHLRGPAGSALNGRLKGAQLAPGSFASVSGLFFEPFYGNPCRSVNVGDAMSVIAPLAGNGMSLALESGEVAVSGLTQYCRGELDWSEMAEELRSRYCLAFRRRLRSSLYLQRLLLNPLIHPFFRLALIRNKQIFQLLFRLTRT